MGTKRLIKAKKLKLPLKFFCLQQNVPKLGLIVPNLGTMSAGASPQLLLIHRQRSRPNHPNAPRHGHAINLAALCLI